MMIQWDEIPEADQAKLVNAANQMAVINPASSPAGYLGGIIDALERELYDAYRIPAHLFETTEKAGSGR